MNLRGIANASITRINPNIDAVLKVNQGFDVDEAGEQIASFFSEQITIQTQSLSTNDIERLGLISQQGQFLYVYANGQLPVLRRAEGKGLERLMFKPYGESEPVEWVIKQVVESYPNWVKVLVWRQ